MSDVVFLPIDPQRLEAMRRRGADEFGNAWTVRRAEGWEPLRCCLRAADADESIALICYTPWTSPSPWAEAGPVFVHYGRCAGYATPERYPEALAHSRRMLNPFDTSGARAYDRITFVEEDDDHESAVRRIMDAPDVAFLHVRSTAAGCFTFEVRRAA